VVGLCGNFNGNQKDDFTTPQGGPPASRPTVFADSWKVKSNNVSQLQCLLPM